MSSPQKPSLAPLSIYFALARIAVAVLLFFALRQQPHNFYVVLRFAVTAVAAWGVYRILKTVPELWAAALAGFAMLVVFNPFMPMTFDRKTWAVLNVIAAIAILISLFIVDGEPTFYAFGTRAGKTILMLVGLTLGVGFIGAGLWLNYVMCKDLYRASKLAMFGNTAQAQIRHVSNYVVDQEGGGYKDVYVAEYRFTVDAKEIVGELDVDDDPLKDVSPDKYVWAGKGKRDLRAGHEIPVNVLYEESNPHYNSAERPIKIIASEVVDFLLGVLVSLMPLYLGRAILKITFGKEEGIPGNA